ncbi:hypothetical protein LLE49_23140 [Alicyclobacillus tolerans]|nr:hypothetical protein [Alicyclobacillus tolerans]
MRPVFRLRGIVNGTSSYVLTRMHENGMAVNSALTETL